MRNQVFIKTLQVSSKVKQNSDIRRRCSKLVIEFVPPSNLLKKAAEIRQSKEEEFKVQAAINVSDGRPSSWRDSYTSNLVEEHDFFV